MSKIVDFLKNQSIIKDVANNKINSGDVLVSNPLKTMFENTKSLDSNTINDVGDTIGNIWDSVLHGNSTKIAKQNFELQQQNLEYQKQLQDEMFKREDSSYTRMVQDMRNAGLNPLNGNPLSSGEAIPTQAPQRDYNYQSMASLSAVSEIIGMMLNAQTQKANIENINAQTNKTNAEATSIANTNSIFDFDIEKGIREYLFQSGKQDYYAKIWDNYNKKRNIDLDRLMGWSENMPDYLKAISLGLNYKILDNGKIDFDKLGNGLFNDDGLSGKPIYNYKDVTTQLSNNVLDLVDSIIKMPAIDKAKQKTKDLGNKLISILTGDFDWSNPFEWFFGSDLEFTTSNGTKSNSHKSGLIDRLRGK